MARKKKNAGSVPLTSPQTREEHYLANIAGLVGTKPEYPFTRTERYLDAISGANSETYKEAMSKGENCFDNPCFEPGYVVNQLGITSWSSETKTSCVDRWFIKGTAQLGASGLTVTGTLSQKVYRHKNENIVAYALALKESSSYLIQGTYRSETNEIEFECDGETITYCDYEDGEVQTYFAKNSFGNWYLKRAYPDYKIELMKCQYYLYVIKAINNNIQIGFATGLSNGTGVLAPIDLIPMKSIPAVSADDIANLIVVQLTSSTSSNATFDGITFDTNTGKAMLHLEGLTGITTGTIYRIMVKSGTKLAFVCEQ